MAAPAPRLLRVRCATWDQVEAFYRRKLRPGGRLTMKVGFATSVGAPVTLVLELPNQIALSVDGEVTGGEGEGKAVEVTLRGLTSALVGRLESLVADARSGALDPEALDDEARLLSARRTELARLRRLPAHEVLGVPREPSHAELRGAWLALAAREHPDAVARYGSPALTAAATQVMALAGAAYDRVRSAVQGDVRGMVTAAVLRPLAAWRDDGEFAEAVTPPPVDEHELAGGPMPRLITPPDTDVDAPLAVEPEATRPAQLVPLDAMLSGPIAAPPPSASTLPRVRASQVLAALQPDAVASGRVGGGDRFVRQVREQLAAGDHAGAGRLAEAALQLYPDDGRLRGLVAVAAAMAACARGDREAAVVALETARAADPSCGEASTALAELRHVAVPSVQLIQRWFA